MGEGRQDPKATPITAGTDPGGAKAPGKAPPLPGRAANGGPGSGVSPVAPAVAPPPPPFMPSPSARPPPSAEPEELSDDAMGIDVPIDTDPPMAMPQSGDTAPPPPELAAPGMPHADLEAVPGPAAVPEPTPVDFDALHAALGEGSREAAPLAPTPTTPMVAPPQHVSAHANANAPAKAGRPVAADSQGRSSATYASSRAQAPPAAHIDVDLQAPAVIVAQEDVLPPAAQHLTTPMTPAVAAMHASHPASGPHQVGAPSSGGMRAVPPHAAAAHAPTGNTPQAFNAAALGLPPVRPGQVALTMRMPERPRRPRTPTVVVRSRGPSTRQKFMVFSIMLLLVSMIGLGIVFWRAPQLFGFGPALPPAAPETKPALIAPPVATTATAAATTTATASATATATSAAAPSVSAAPPATSPAAPPPKPAIKPKTK